MASRVKKAGEGHPSPSAVSKLCDKIDEDGRWYPGKFIAVALAPAKQRPKQEATCYNGAANAVGGQEAGGLEATPPKHNGIWQEIGGVLGGKLDIYIYIYIYSFS